MLGALQHPNPQFWGQQLVVVEHFYVQYPSYNWNIKILAAVAGDQKQKYIPTYLIC